LAGNDSASKVLGMKSLISISTNTSNCNGKSIQLFQDEALADIWSGSAVSLSYTQANQLSGILEPDLSLQQMNAINRTLFVKVASNGDFI